MSEYDIVLVNPDALPDDRRVDSSIGLATLEAYLTEHAIRCRTIHSSEIDSHLSDADVFGISVMDHTYMAARELTRRLKDKIVIWGGWTATALPEFVLKENPDVDYVILREGEQRLLALLRSFSQPEQFDRIDGIAYRDGNSTLTVRPPTAWVNMDDLPIPARLASLNGIVFLEIARGCHGRCGYCQETHRMRFKSLSKTMVELEYRYAQGYRRFLLGDANSVANGKLLAALVREIEIRKLEVEILLTGRPDDIVRGQGIFESIFASPFVHLFWIEVGVEANSQHALDLLQRRSTPDMNRQAVAALLALKARHRSQAQVHANIILFPHYDMTLEDFVENVRFIGDFQCSREVLTLQLYGLANTPLWFQMRDRGFRQHPEQGLEVIDYPFTDPQVNRLFDKLVKNPLRLHVRHKENYTYLDLKQFQHRCYDQVLEFYHSPDLRESIEEFVTAV